MRKALVAISVALFLGGCVVAAPPPAPRGVVLTPSAPAPAAPAARRSRRGRPTGARAWARVGAGSLRVERRGLRLASRILGHARAAGTRVGARSLAGRPRWLCVGGGTLAPITSRGATGRPD